MPHLGTSSRSATTADLKAAGSWARSRIRPAALFQMALGGADPHFSADIRARRDLAPFLPGSCQQWRYLIKAGAGGRPL